MSLGWRARSTRRSLIAAGCGVAALAAVLFVAGDLAQAAPVSGPDVTVFDFTDVSSYGSANGFTAYSLGTVACNRGGAPLNWCDHDSGCAPQVGPTEHPVIAQNLYRLKDGRFQQIGMSWLKHGFFAANWTAAGCAGSTGQSCQMPAAGGSQLGAGCVDPYTANLNGSRPLGPRSEVNATTGAFPFPPMSPDGPYAIYDQRIKVATADVDPTLNPGATFWIEGQYVASDDAGTGNALNNASYRQVTVGGAPSYTLAMTGSFVEKQPAIFAWAAQDPAVDLVDVDVPGPIVERLHAARKVTDLGGGVWHYEYAVHNQNSDRSTRAFTLEFPGTTHFTNVGFHAVEHHSGEPYAVDDWSVSSSGSQLSWSTDTFGANPNANALRFATMFNFWFDADQPPSPAIGHTLGLFKPGDPAAVVFSFDNKLFFDGFESGDTSAWSAAFNASSKR